MSTKQLTVHGCCDKVDITVGNTTVMFGSHKFAVNIFYCKNCGSEKATSNIQHLKEVRYERQSSQSISGGKRRSTAQS